MQEPIASAHGFTLKKKLMLRVNFQKNIHLMSQNGCPTGSECTYHRLGQCYTTLNAAFGTHSEVQYCAPPLSGLTHLHFGFFKYLE